MMMSNAKRADRYTAAWSAEDHELTVIRDIWAGVGGPIGEYPAASLDEADLELAAQEFRRASPWEDNGRGVWWCCLVAPGHCLVCFEPVEVDECDGSPTGRYGECDGLMCPKCLAIAQPYSPEL